MKIEIQSLNFSLSLSQYRYIEQRLGSALGANVDNIEHTELWLSEVRLAAGDVLKRCVIHVKLRGETMIVSESSDSGLRVAINRAANQASWKVTRSLARQNPAPRVPHPGAMRPAVGTEATYCQRSA